MPDTRNEDNVVRLNAIANDITSLAEANDDLPNAAVLDGCLLYTSDAADE